MIIESRSRGQPLLALVLVIGGWIGVRALAWDQALRAEEAVGIPVVPGLTPPPEAPSAAARQAAMLPHAPTGRMTFAASPEPAAIALLPPTVMPVAPQVEVAPMPVSPAVPVPEAAPAQATASGRIAGAAGHHALWLAATALMPLPPLGLRQPAPAPATPARRWSADGWLLLRPNPEVPITPGPLPGTYGASQAGAVIRFRLDTTSPFKPSIYARGAAAIGKQREHEAALGLSARPIPALPLVAMAEARVNESRGARARVRPALAVVTELPPRQLPLGFTGELYAQGGWVGGRKPTAFIDGLVRVERPVAAFGPDFTLKAGGGAWGAKQRGASRLDIGPVASLSVRLGDTGATARVEADWRLRVGGRSRPESGPVLTLSTGF